MSTDHSPMLYYLVIAAAAYLLLYYLKLTKVRLPLKLKRPSEEETKAEPDLQSTVMLTDLEMMSFTVCMKMSLW